MNFYEEFVGKDCTYHGDNGRKYRGVLVEIRNDRGNIILVMDVGIDKFYIAAAHVIALTEHGREFKD